MRLIVDYPRGMSAEDALFFVREVVKGGRISRSAGRAHFCWLTVTSNDHEEIQVVTKRRRRKDAADSFDVRRTTK